MNDYIHIPDPIELGEARAEAAHDELWMGGDSYKCPCCDRIFDINEEGGTIWDDPWAPPACGECLSKAFEGHDV